MDTFWGVLIAIGILLVQPALNQFWIILQLFFSFFRRKVDLKKRYGSWAVVTGCTDGIGRSFVHRLAQKGLNVVLISRNLSKLESLSVDVKKRYHVDTKIIVADFSKGRDIYSDIREKLKEVDVGILVNNVGIQYTYPMYFGELPEQELWDLLNVNLGSLTQMTHIVLPGMVQRNRGAIINLSSVSKFQPIPFMNMYAASKIFIDYFTEALRYEYRNTSLTIQSLCPFYVSTKINHFSKDLRRINFFTPDSDSYVAQALNTLGLVDNTTGYWPHRLQIIGLSIVPVWLRTMVAGTKYSAMRTEYLKTSPKIQC